MSANNRILILSTAYLPEIGGSELAIRNITDRLVDFEFDLITSHPGGDISEFERMGRANVYRVGRILRKLNFILPKLFLPIVVFWQARKLVAKNKYFALHVYQASQAGGGAWLLKWCYPKLPLILTIQEGKDLENQGWLLNFFRKLIFYKANLVTVISEHLKFFALRVRKSVPVVLIPNGVDLESLKPKKSAEEIRKKLNIQENDKVVVTVSRLVPKNGMINLVKAFGILNKYYPVKLALLGSGQLRDSLVSLADELGIRDKIIFVGDVSNDHLGDYFQVSNVFVRPSLSEGLGTAFLEAMGFGLPVVGTRVGGIPDFIKDRETGLFCDPTSPIDIAEKIRLVLDDIELNKKLAQNGQNLVTRKYTWQIVAEQMRKVYQRFT